MKTVTITIYGQPNHEGKVNYDADWPANNIGYSCNESGIRGQSFLANVESHIDNWKRKEYQITIIHKPKA